MMYFSFFLLKLFQMKIFNDFDFLPMPERAFRKCDLWYLFSDLFSLFFRQRTHITSLKSRILGLKSRILILYHFFLIVFFQTCPSSTCLISVNSIIICQVKPESLNFSLLSVLTAIF